jgi:hypothetical protein
MNKITHGIFFIFILFQILCSSKVEAQYLNSNSNKMPLSFISSQYWQNSYTVEDDSVVIDASHWYLRVPHKFGIGLLLGGLGGLAGTGLGAIITPNSWLGFVILAPVGYTILSAVGVNSVASIYGQNTSYGIVFLAGALGYGLGIPIGTFLSNDNVKNDELGYQLLSGLFLSLALEIFFSELNFNTSTDEEWDEYIYNETDKLVFHEYVKTTQVFNFELLRIQL